MIYGNRFLKRINSEMMFSDIDHFLESTIKNDQYIFGDECIISESNTIILTEGVGDVIKKIFGAIKSAITKFIGMIRTAISNFISKIKGLFSRGGGGSTASTSSVNNTSTGTSAAQTTGGDAGTKQPPVKWVDYSSLLPDLTDSIINPKENFVDIVNDYSTRFIKILDDIVENTTKDNYSTNLHAFDTIVDEFSDKAKHYPDIVFSSRGKLRIDQVTDSEGFKQQFDQMLSKQLDPETSNYTITVENNEKESTKNKFMKAISKALADLDKYKEKITAHLKKLINDIDQLETNLNRIINSKSDFNFTYKKYSKGKTDNVTKGEYRSIYSTIVTIATKQRTTISNYMTEVNNIVKKTCSAISKASVKAGLTSKEAVSSEN